MNVHLDLDHPDALRILRRSLENYQLVNQSIAARDRYQAEIQKSSLTDAQHASLMRRVGIYVDRAAVCTGLLAQLPPTAPLLAPLDP